MLRRFLQSVLLIALTIAPVAAQAASDAYLKTLRASGHVNDFAGVFPPPDKQALELLLRELNLKTGAEVAVVTVKSMQGGEVNDFASRLFEQWGIGKKGRDNGVLLFAAVGDRKARIEVGYGLEPLIPDARAGRILDESVIPWFRKDQYARGLIEGAAAIAQRIADDAGVSLGALSSSHPPTQAAHGQEGRPSWLHILFLVILIAVVIRHPWLLFFLLSNGRGSGTSGGGFGGGFGGFGGGLSGGGGASRGW